MPEQHSSVPGFDTLIRFMVPLLDSFGLYGRPKRLKADRIDPDSLLFGLPTLPHVHYLELGDLLPFTARGDFLSWDVKQWSSSLKDIMRGKLSQGYEGCGSSRGVVGAINSLNSPTLSDHKIPTPPPKDSRRQVPQQQKYQQPPAPSRCNISLNLSLSLNIVRLQIKVNSLILTKLVLRQMLGMLTT